MRKFVLFDVHGAYIALRQVFERCGIDREKDLLITLGDICDGWKYVYECVEELLTFKNRIDIIGNHDDWFYRWLNTGVHPDDWVQGGRGTALSYLRQIGKEDLFSKSTYSSGFVTALLPSDIPMSHVKFFAKQELYHLDAEKRLFVHGGFNRHQTLLENAALKPSDFYWDRDLIVDAMAAAKRKRPLKFIEEFSKIFIGHTETNNLLSYIEKGIIREISELNQPIFADIVINGDTGAGSRGRLTIMDIDTLEYWQSDKVNHFYGNYKPRG